MWKQIHIFSIDLIDGILISSTFIHVLLYFYLSFFLFFITALGRINKKEKVTIVTPFVNDSQNGSLVGADLRGTGQRSKFMSCALRVSVGG